jgi:hypothetical protein
MRIFTAPLISAVLAMAVLFAANPAGAADTREAMERAYRSYQRAVLAQDFDKILERVSAATRKEMLSYPKDKRAKGLGFLRQMVDYTKSSKVVGSTIDGDKGVLKVQVPVKKGSMTGDIILRKEGDRWRVHSQNWHEKD